MLPQGINLWSGVKETEGNVCISMILFTGPHVLCTSGRCVEREDTLRQERLLQGLWRASSETQSLVGQKAISSVSQFASNSEVAQERVGSAQL